MYSYNKIIYLDLDKFISYSPDMNTERVKVVENGEYISNLLKEGIERWGQEIHVELYKEGDELPPTVALIRQDSQANGQGKDIAENLRKQYPGIFIISITRCFDTQWGDKNWMLGASPREMVRLLADLQHEALLNVDPGGLEPPTS